MNSFISQTYQQGILALICVVLIVINLVQLFVYFEPPNKPELTVIKTNLSEEAGKSISEQNNIEVYQVVTDAPLFEPTRKQYIKPIVKKPVSRPVQEIDEPVIKPVAPQLLGILKLKKRDIAFIVENGHLRALSLTVGDHIQKWTVKSVQPDKIILAYGDNEEVIQIRPEMKKQISIQDSDKLEPLPDDVDRPSQMYEQGSPKDRLSRIMH